MLVMRLPSITDEYYHVYNRGVDKRVIFNDPADYKRFLLLLLVSNDTNSSTVVKMLQNQSAEELANQPRNPLVEIHSFCLLPNHYHMIISPKTDGGIAKFFQKVATGYTMYFNKRNERSGSLFQGKYKIKHLSDDRYLRYMFEYIHLNPVRDKFDKSNSEVLANQLIADAETYPWSSLSVLGHYVREELCPAILNSNLFFELFDTYETHRNHLISWRDQLQGSTLESFPRSNLGVG